MPFTLSHAAAALPLRKTRLSTTALVVGTFAPDFHYFLHFAPRGGYGHTPAGAFTISLPMALAVLWLYENIVRDPLISLLPTGLRNRLGNTDHEASFATIRNFSWAALSALIGIATHILWDSFTHRTMWPYRHFSFLQTIFIIPGYGTRPLYKLLQLTSSIAGLVILAVWLAWWYRKTVPAQHIQAAQPSLRSRFVTWAIAVVIALAGSALRMWLSRMTDKTTSGPILAAEGAVSFLALLWWELVLYGVFIKLHSRQTIRALKSQQESAKLQ